MKNLLLALAALLLAAACAKKTQAPKTSSVKTEQPLFL
jgi:outer membrane biogenesis lipoprotein LolB